MRRILLPAAVALVLAIGLVLALAGGEEDVVVEPGTGGATDAETGVERPQTGTGTAGESPGPSDAEGAAGVEQAVILYIEAAEAGEVDAPRGLPNTDELSIEDVRVEGDRATVKLAGGATLSLRERGGRWRVERARPGRVPRPTPPSGF
jgi:hypothetical protein